MTKGRTKFAVAGTHPLLYNVRDFFIQRLGLVLVPWEDQPDFALVGAELPKDAREVPFEQLQYQQESIRDVPVLLLSSSSVYTSPTKTRLFAASSCELPDPSWDYAAQAVYAGAAEYIFQNISPQVIVARTFGVYGRDIVTSPVVDSFLQQARKKESLTIHGAGFQVRSFLYQDDLWRYMRGLVNALMRGTSGVVNLGSEEEVSIERLAAHIWQLTNPDAMDMLAHRMPKKTRQHVVPNTQSLAEMTNCWPTMSLRKGLWTMIGEADEG